MYENKVLSKNRILEGNILCQNGNLNLNRKVLKNTLKEEISNEDGQKRMEESH